MPGALDPLSVLKLDRERVLRLATKVGPARMRKLLVAAQKDLDRRLRSRAVLAGAHPDDTFTAAQMRASLAQVREALKALDPAMRDELVSTGREAGALHAEGTLRYLDAAERRYRGIVRPLPLDTAAVLDAATRGAEASVLRRISNDPAHPGRPGILERYGAAVIGRFEEQMQLRLVARRSIEETRAGLIEQSTFLKGAPLHWAERIARTEAIGASNAAGLETIRAAGLALDGMLKILVATFDSRTACLRGSARLTGGVVRTLFRRTYEGPIVRLVTEAGRDLSATPNHPMLTRRGWVRADELRFGDELVCHGRQEDSRPTRNQDVANGPPTLAELFESLSIGRHVQRRRGRDEDFHGDGCDGDVEVLHLDRELRFGTLSSFREPSAKQVFAPSHAPDFCPKCDALLGQGTSEESRRSGSRSLRNSSGDDASFDGGLRSADVLPDSLQRLAEAIALGDVLGGEIGSIPGMVVLVGKSLFLRGSVWPSEPPDRQLFRDISAMGSHRCGHFGNGQPGDVKLDRLVGIEVGTCREHVFNLSTADGFFTVDDAYTSNCDSYAVHGQIRRPDEPFDTWQGPVMHPPSRPNDRETVVPHRASWPIPATLKPKSDGEVAARWAAEGRKGSPPSRPKLSTVDLAALSSHR